MPISTINTERVTHVLLPDGWHKVGQIFPEFADSALSFDVVPFILDNGEGETSAPVPGFAFNDAHTGCELHGPLSSVRGVRTAGLSAPVPLYARLWRRAVDRVSKLSLRPAAVSCLLFAVLLLLCGRVAAFPTTAQVTQRTLEHLDSMTNLTAVQKMSDGKQYDVLMLAGEQWYRQGAKYRNRLPRGDRGLFLGSEWYWLLRESLAWPLRGADGHYTFESALCMFGERHGGKWVDSWYPCHGSVDTDADGNVQNITKIIEPRTKLTEIVTISVSYKWEQLSTRRLVPASLFANAKLSIGWFAVTAQWSGYREYRGTEPAVTEIDGPAVDASLSGGSVIHPAPVTGEDLGEPPPVPVLRSERQPQPAQRPQVGDLLERDNSIETTTGTSKVSKWKELWRRTQVIKIH